MAGKNPYPGVNAHLNSYLQFNGWAGFHGKFLTHLSDILDIQLPDTYHTYIESSLQFSHKDPSTDLFDSSRVFPFYRKNKKVNLTIDSSKIATPNLKFRLEDILFPEKTIRSIIIYSIANNPLGDKLYPIGKPVVRIELLSLSSKPSGTHYWAYLKERSDWLQKGLLLVEIDFLHERRPILPQIPSYVDSVSNSTPYHVIISNPKPYISKGEVDIYQIGLFDPLPKFYVPLEGEDKFILDLAQAYQQVYDGSRLFRQLGNPATELKNPEAYSPDDRAKLADFIKKTTE